MRIIKSFISTILSMGLLISPVAARVMSATGSHNYETNTFSVHNSPGGIIRSFLYRIELADRKDTQIKISGYCASACTLYLGAKNVCVDKDTQLMFHAPYYFNEFGYKVVMENDPRFMQLYPRSIQAWLKDNGGLIEPWIVLRGDAMARLVPVCNAPVSYTS